MHAKSLLKGAVGFFFVFIYCQNFTSSLSGSFLLKPLGCPALKRQWLWGQALRTSEADALLGRMVWDCCPSVASSHKKPRRDLVAVDVQEMVVLWMLTWRN